MPFIDTDELEVREPRPGWKGRFFNTTSMTFGYWEFAAGSSIHEHSHPNEEVWHVLAGELEITVASETRLVRPGSAAIVPTGFRHAVKALTDGRALVVDHPARHVIGGVHTE